MHNEDIKMLTTETLFNLLHTSLDFALNSASKLNNSLQTKQSKRIVDDVRIADLELAPKHQQEQINDAVSNLYDIANRYHMNVMTLA